MSGSTRGNRNWNLNNSQYHAKTKSNNVLSCTHNCSLIYLFLKEKHTINKKETPNSTSLNFHIMFKAFNIKSDSTFACFKSFSKHILHIYFSKLKCARPKVLRSTFWEIYKMRKLLVTLLAACKTVSWEKYIKMMSVVSLNLQTLLSEKVTSLQLV